MMNRHNNNTKSRSSSNQLKNKGTHQAQATTNSKPDEPAFYQPTSIKESLILK
jgi:hypothetical protein